MKSAILMAAGKGTRMHSDLPKVMHQVCGKPMLSHIIDNCRKASVERIVTIVGYGHEIAGSMDTTLDLQIKFLETNVMDGKKRIVEAWIDDPNVYKGVGVQSRKDLFGN